MDGRETHSCPALRIAKPGFFPPALCAATGEVLDKRPGGQIRKGARCPLDGATVTGICLIPINDGIKIVPFGEVKVSPSGEETFVEVS